MTRAQFGEILELMMLAVNGILRVSVLEIGGLGTVEVWDILAFQVLMWISWQVGRRFMGWGNPEVRREVR